MDCSIYWYGRCCFLVKIENKKVLFDPYDRFCNIDIGLIDADIVLSSSTWHDHGHIGTSPKAQLFTYAGTEEYLGFQITGIEARENRGTPTIVFNLQYQEFSITNFADLGSEHDDEFNKSLTTSQRNILRNTSIAFLRANEENQNGLRYCNPALIIPEHYIPLAFISEHIPQDEKNHFYEQNRVAEEMGENLHIPVEKVSDFQVSLRSTQLKDQQKILQFMRVHPQVEYNPI